MSDSSENKVPKEEKEVEEKSTKSDNENEENEEKEKPKTEISTPVKKTSSPETPQRQTPKSDRYGFAIHDDKANEVISKKEKELRQKESEKESERMRKWQQMFAKNEFKKLGERVKKGIPDAFRSLAYQRILLGKVYTQKELDRKPDVSSLYPDIPESEWKESHSCWSTIEVDLDRTMPDSTLFSEQSRKNSLRNILKAYSCEDEELGYTQGMGFHAAMFLTYMEEKAAYLCFKAMMKSFGVRNFFLPGFPRLGELGKVWKVVFQKKYKKIYNRFERDNIDVMMYIPQWFLSAYMNQQFEPILRLRIFDRYVAYKSAALLSFGLVIISRHKEEFLNQGMEVVVPLLQRPSSSPKFKDWRYIIKKWDQHWITHSEYVSFCKKAKVEYFP